MDALAKKKKKNDLPVETLADSALLGLACACTWGDPRLAPLPLHLLNCASELLLPHSGYLLTAHGRRGALPSPGC